MVITYVVNTAIPEFKGTFAFDSYTMIAAHEGTRY
jgi:hypothetical protein